MPRLIWSPAALEDVARLHAFLVPKNRDAAKRGVGAIRHGVKLLGQHPAAGRPAEEMSTEFREFADELFVLERAVDFSRVEEGDADVYRPAQRRDGVAFVLAAVGEAHARAAIADGRLVRLLDPWCPPFPGFFLYYPTRRQMRPALRAFIDFFTSH